MRTQVLLNAALLSGALIALPACKEQKPVAAPAGTGTKQPAPAPKNDHDHDHDHDHDDHGGVVVALGESAIGPFTVKATREGDAVAAGKEGHFDISVTPGAAEKVAAVRLWIGTQDAKGSMKAMAEAESDHPGSYHAHVEAPSPMPEGSRLWVEVEDDKGAKHVGGFDLKS